MRLRRLLFATSTNLIICFSMKKITHRITDKDSAYRIGKLIASIEVNKPLMVTVEKENRTLANNAAQWPILGAFADQLQWPVNGKMVYMSAEDWKDLLTAAYRNETVRLAMGLDGGVVMLGQRTSKFKREDWPDWMAFLESVAADRGVKIPISKRQALELGFVDA